MMAAVLCEATTVVDLRSAWAATPRKMASQSVT
jgi:hypothetical protein